LKAYYAGVAIIAVLALVGIAAPTLILGLMFTVIGIPLAAILSVAPALAAILIPAVVLQATVFRAIPHLSAATRGGLGVVLSIGLALALNATFAWVGRESGVADLDAIVADDRTPDQPVVLSGTVGVVVDGDPSGLGLFECPDLCQRLLLKGLADRVVLAHANKVPEVPPPDKFAIAWRMERREVCPKVELNTNSDTLVIPGEPERSIGSTRPVDLMNLEVAGGNCLIREEAPYGRPDFTILDVNVRQGAAQGRSASLIRHDATGDVTLARQTLATADVLGPLVLPVPDLSMNGPSGVGAWRETVSPDQIGRSPAPGSFADFLSGTLGLDLALVTADSGTTVRDKVNAVLDQPGPVPDSAEPLIASYLQSFAFGTMTDPADQDILLRILARPEISLPFWTSTGLPRAAPDNVDLYLKVADLTFARLPVSAPDSSTGEAVDGLIDRLPAEVIKARSDTVLRLAADPQVRLVNSRIVSRLSDVGAAAGPVLIDILREPERAFTGDLKFVEFEAWQDQQTWSFVALCRGGTVFADLGPDLKALIATGTVNARSVIALKSLLRVGFTRDELAALPSRSAAELARDLDRATREAASEDCWR
jgi:hypothetical protein